MLDLTLLLIILKIQQSSKIHIGDNNLNFYRTEKTPKTKLSTKKGKIKIYYRNKIVERQAFSKIEKRLQ
jgi:hypothetical protein